MSAYPYSAGLVAEVADEEYVGLQLELIENSFLSFYRDTMLKRCIPLKLLLCSKMDWRDARGAMKLYNVYSGYDYLAFNWGSAEIVSMTTDQKKVFKVEANKLFLERLLDKKKIVVRISNAACVSCIQDFCAVLFQYFSGSEIIYISDYGSAKELFFMKQILGIENQVYRVEALKLPIDKEKKFYVFIIDKDLSIEKFFLPHYEQKGLMIYYLDLLKKTL